MRLIVFVWSFCYFKSTLVEYFMLLWINRNNMISFFWSLFSLILISVASFHFAQFKIVWTFGLNQNFSVSQGWFIYFSQKFFCTMGHRNFWAEALLQKFLYPIVQKISVKSRWINLQFINRMFFCNSWNLKKWLLLFQISRVTTKQHMVYKLTHIYRNKKYLNWNT